MFLLYFCGSKYSALNAKNRLQIGDHVEEIWGK
jgi:hypothetical protein